MKQDVGAHNARVSAKEVAAFIREKPRDYFLYVSETTKLATTWTGEKLGDVTFGRAYQGNFGWRNERVPVRIKAINGCEYYGTYYKSAGDYARIRRVKGAA